MLRKRCLGQFCLQKISLLRGRSVRHLQLQKPNSNSPSLQQCQEWFLFPRSHFWGCCSLMWWHQTEMRQAVRLLLYLSCSGAKISLSKNNIKTSVQSSAICQPWFDKNIVEPTSLNRDLEFEIWVFLNRKLKFPHWPLLFWPSTKVVSISCQHMAFRVYLVTL